jgi:hypothetical protein
MDGDHIYPEKQVFPETFFRNGRIQVLMGGAQQAGVDRYGSGTAHALKAPEIQDTKK